MTKETPGQENEGQPIPERPVGNRRAGPTFAEPEEPVADLSSEILKTLPRASGERVTCRRITGNHYRCNWWSALKSNDRDVAMTGLAVTTHRVSKSQMLYVTRTADGLSIKPVSSS